MGPTPNASPSPGAKSKENLQWEAERRKEIERNRIERIEKEKAEREEILAQATDPATDWGKAALLLARFYQFFGQAVFLVLPWGSKKLKEPGWEKTTFGQTQEPGYQLRLLKAIRRGGNIAVLLGPASGGLCAVDGDVDFEWVSFLAGNAGLQERTRTRGWHGGQVFFRLKPGSNYPNSKAVYPIKLKGGQIGEWRCGGGAYSVIFGRHPDKEHPGITVDYKIEKEVPLEVLEDFGSIWWPPDWELTWNEEEVTPPSGLPSIGAPASPPEASEDVPGVTIAALSKEEQKGLQQGCLAVSKRTPKLDQRIKGYLDSVDPAVDGEGEAIRLIASPIYWCGVLP
jgi:hypothetical protein